MGGSARLLRLAAGDGAGVSAARFTDAQIAAIRRDGKALGVRAASRKHGCSAPYVSDLLRDRRRPAPLRVRALRETYYEPSTGKLWNAEFWYGDGSPATVRCAVLRRDDYLALRKAAKAPK
jgi:hypothetical protein